MRTAFSWNVCRPHNHIIIKQNCLWSISAQNVTSAKGTLRKVSHLRISLVMVFTLVLLTCCNVIGLSKLYCHVWSALLQSPTMAPPPYFVYICLSAIPFSIYFASAYTLPSKSYFKMSRQETSSLMVF